MRLSVALHIPFPSLLLHLCGASTSVVACRTERIERGAMGNSELRWYLLKVCCRPYLDSQTLYCLIAWQDCVIGHDLRCHPSCSYLFQLQHPASLQPNTSKLPPLSMQVNGKKEDITEKDTAGTIAVNLTAKCNLAR